MTHPRQKLTGAFGFTLVEMVVTIVLTAIVAGFVAMFLATPIESYFAQTRRSALVDSANRIADAVTSDVRTALPNSLRAASPGRGVHGLELLATDTTTIGTPSSTNPTGPTARYYGPGDAGKADVNFFPPFPGTTKSFQTLDLFNMYEKSMIPIPRTSPDLLSIGNLGIPGYDAYDTRTAGGAEVGVMTLLGNTISIVPQGPAGTPTEDLVTLKAKIRLPQPPAGVVDRNAYLVTGPVSYVCDPLSSGDVNAGTVKKYAGYGVSARQRVPPAMPRRGGVVSLIAQNVTSCSIYTVSASATNYDFGEIAVLSVTISSGGESVQLFLEAPTKYDQ